MAEDVFVHPQALCESAQVGAGTRIWAFAHVMKGARLGCECNICQGAFIESGAQLGHRVTVKNQVAVWDGVVVEDGVFLGPACVLTNDRRPRSRQGQKRAAKPRDQTLIRQGASVGAGAVLVCPLKIGRFALIGAGAVVTRDAPDHALMVGHPARRVGWVCECGQTLTKDLDCPDCGLAFERAGPEGLARR